MRNPDKKPAKKSQLVWEQTVDGFLVPSGAVNPLAPHRKKWDLLDSEPGAPPNVTGPWPGGRPR